jgi:hypothetical protein
MCSDDESDEDSRDGGRKGGAAGKGVKKPRMTTAEKELLPQGVCTGCGKSGVLGAKHCAWSKQESKAEACGYFH